MSNLLSKFLAWRKQRNPSAIIIDTPYGPTSESARKQAAMNMKGDAKIKEAVENLLIEQKGSVEAGMKESKRRYPEAYTT